MRCTHRCVLVSASLVVFANYAHAQNVPPQGLPSSLIRVFEKTEADIRRNREEFEKANEKTLAQFNKNVEKESDRLSKAGKPEEALALKDSAEAWFQQLIGKSAPDAFPQMPIDPDDKRKNPNGRVRLVDVKPIVTEGVCEIKDKHEGNRPIINGQPTTEPFVFTVAPSKIAWEVPEGKKVFRSWVYYYGHASANADHSAIMEVQADGRPIARSPIISFLNRVGIVEARLPAGTKTLTLVADPNGNVVYDSCVWVNPSFFDR